MRSLYAGLLAMFLAAPTAHAVTLQADADTFIASGTGANNSLGTLGGLQAKQETNSTAPDFLILTRFDLNGISGSIANATLTMSVFSNSFANDGLPDFSYRFYWMSGTIGDDSWDEATATWNTFNAVQALSNQIIFIGSATIPSNSGFNEELSISAPLIDDALNNDLGSDGLITFVIEAEQTEFVTFASKEGSILGNIEPPTLTFDITAPPPAPVPVPASLPLAIAALGGVTLLAGMRAQRSKRE